MPTTMPVFGLCGCTPIYCQAITTLAKSSRPHGRRRVVDSRQTVPALRLKHFHLPHPRHNFTQMVARRATRPRLAGVSERWLIETACCFCHSVQRHPNSFNGSIAISIPASDPYKAEGTERASSPGPRLRPDSNHARSKDQGTSW